VPTAAINSLPEYSASPLMLIGGSLCPAEKWLDVIDPAIGAPFARVPECSEHQLDAAVVAARAAFPAWASTPPRERQQAVKKMISRIRENAGELAELLTREQGKPLSKAKSEIDAALFFANSFAEMDLEPEIIRETESQKIEIHYRPLGVVGAIAAWNYPLLLSIWKLAPALVAGNTVIVKPSPFTPVATLRVGELLADIFPRGVANIVSGGDDLGRWMTAHDGINKISFTGSIETGKHVMRSAAGNLKRVTLELGGNDAGIVLDDVDPSRIAEELFWAAFSNCGQVCAGLKRLFVPARMEERIADALASYASNVKVGAGFDDDVQIGPIQNKPQFDRLTSLLKDTTETGAEIYFQGKVPKGPGYFVPVTLVRGARPGSRIVDEEQFGPVLPIICYETEDEAIALANDTAFGLGASVWASDPDRAALVATRLEAGSRWVNQHPAMAPDVPFGGIKQSGVGVECSILGLREYTNAQVLSVKRG
jgi:acyl-CoA reductase-like NAD-dependent aldehyde dehydrogenase